MKKNTLIAHSGIVAALATTLMVGSCNTPSQKVDKAKEEVAMAKDDLDKAREEYQAEIAKFKIEEGEKIAANEKLIADLKATIKDSKRAARTESAELVDAAEKQNRMLKTRLEDLNADSKDKWQSFKEEFNNDMSELGKSIAGLTKDNVK